MPNGWTVKIAMIGAQYPHKMALRVTPGNKEPRRLHGLFLKLAILDVVLLSSALSRRTRELYM